MVNVKTWLAVLGLIAAVGVMFAKESCVSNKKTENVRGGSLSGIVEDGESVKVWEGYYNCHPVRRNDIVLYKYADKPAPLIKIVKAVPGDNFRLEQVGNGWRIRLNGERLANSEGEPYRLADAQMRVLALYEKDYQGVIPEGAYLLMGNLANGSNDSTRFGLVSKNDLVGKMVR